MRMSDLKGSLEILLVDYHFLEETEAIWENELIKTNKRKTAKNPTQPSETTRSIISVS